VSSRRYSHVETAVAALTYLALVLVMWLPFGPRSGMPYETSFPFWSETEPWWQGFFYLGDPQRIHTSTFYQVSYLLGESLGIGGSFLPYQLVYVALWWARGLLTFLILRRLLPQRILFAFAVGLLVVVHASDGALQWVGQMNQFGFIFWMLLAFYFLARAIEASRARTAALWTVAAVVSEHMSLWSYESQILLLLVVPALFLVRFRVGQRRAVALTAPWYFLIGLYAFLSLRWYQKLGAASYQHSVLRHDWSARSILADWLYNIGESLRFWAWPEPRSEELFLSAGVSMRDGTVSVVWPLLGALVVLAGAPSCTKSPWEVTLFEKPAV
jgi:hypothetical protein